MSFFTYVLFSPKYNRYYKGHCENLDLRITQHNSGKTKSTKPYLPWLIKYYETYETREDAIKREKYFKTAAGRKFLKTKLKT